VSGAILQNLIVQDLCTPGLELVTFFKKKKEWRNGLLLCNMSFHCRVHNIRSLGPNLFRWIIPSTPRPSTRSLSVRFNNKNYVCISLFPYVCCMSCESYHWLFNHLDSIRRRAVCLAAHYVISLQSPYFPTHKTHFFPRKMSPKFDLRLTRRG